MIRALAKAEGFWDENIPIYESVFGGKSGKRRTGEYRSTYIAECPDYLNNFDHPHRVLSKLSKSQKLAYMQALRHTMDVEHEIADWTKMLTDATCMEMCTSIILALDIWEEE